jgi:CheY-like chemotaxis protein
MTLMEPSMAPAGIIAVLDDDADQAKVMKIQLADVGVEALIADLDTVPTIDHAISWIRHNAQAVICDVQLNHGNTSIQYDGAELMATVIGDCRIPGVLTTGFKDDVGMFVRPHRPKIPVLVSRDETEDAAVLLSGVDRCRAEIAHGRAPDRATHRVPLFIEKAGRTETGIALDARVGGWSRKASMRFPARMLGDQFNHFDAARAIVGRAFFAAVNLGAEDETDLFLENVEPELIDPSGLALHFGPESS